MDIDRKCREYTSGAALRQLETGLPYVGTKLLQTCIQMLNITQIKINLGLITNFFTAVVLLSHITARSILYGKLMNTQCCKLLEQNTFTWEVHLCVFSGWDFQSVFYCWPLKTAYRVIHRSGFDSHSSHFYRSKSRYLRDTTVFNYLQ